MTTWVMLKTPTGRVLLDPADILGATERSSLECDLYTTVWPSGVTISASIDQLAELMLNLGAISGDDDEGWGEGEEVEGEEDG